MDQNPYRDILYIPNARHGRPFRVTTTDRCFPTLQEATEFRDHCEQNRDAIEAERKAKLRQREEHLARRRYLAAQKAAGNAFFAEETEHYV